MTAHGSPSSVTLWAIADSTVKPGGATLALSITQHDKRRRTLHETVTVA